MWEACEGTIEAPKNYMPSNFVCQLAASWGQRPLFTTKYTALQSADHSFLSCSLFYLGARVSLAVGAHAHQSYEVVFGTDMLTCMEKAGCEWARQR